MATQPPEPLAGLMRDHRAIEAAVTAVRGRLKRALGGPPAPDTADLLLELMGFQALLERDVERHIAKEERVLFPALRTRLAELSEFIDDMLAEHDAIREQRQRLLTALDELGDDHADVRGTLAELVAALQAGEGLHSLFATLAPLLERLDWLFQGHFTGEEDGLFLPAEELLSAETLSELAEQMTALDAAR